MLLQHIRRGLINILRISLGVLIVALIGLEVAQVFMRYFLSTGVSWGRDVSTLLLFCIAWLGAPYLWLHHRHLAVDLLPTSLVGSRVWQSCIDLLVIVASLALLLVTREAMAAFEFIDLPALGTSAAIKFWPMVFGSILLGLAGILNLMSLFHKP